jgi:hypothetical protein
MYHVATLSRNRCLLPHCLLLNPPLHAVGTHQLSSLPLIYQLCPMHADVFEDTPHPSDQVVRTCCKEISVLHNQLLFSWNYWNLESTFSSYFHVQQTP